MSFSGCFGLKKRKIIAKKNIAEGIITEIKTCWWLKVNTKASRSHSMDGAVFPHIIYFTYKVNGIEYKGSRYVGWAKRCPQVKEKLSVHFDKNKPYKYAVCL